MAASLRIGVHALLGFGEPRRTETRFGMAELAVGRTGRWRVGSISRHLPGYRYLSRQIPHRSNLAALKELDAQACSQRPSSRP